MTNWPPASTTVAPDGASVFSHDFSIAAKYVGIECAVGVNNRAAFY
jgi:hypothetical protein